MMLDARLQAQSLVMECCGCLPARYNVANGRRLAVSTPGFRLCI
jgi:hypothetical protein